MKILLGTSTFAVVDSAPLARLEDEGYEIVGNPYKRRLTKDEITKLLSEGIIGLIAGLEPLDREVLSASELKVVSRCGSGMSNVDVEAAKELGIKVRYTPDAPVASVAELTLGAMLALLRGISSADSQMHKGGWKKKTGSLLEGKTVVMIGFGRISRHLSELLAPFKVKVIAVDPLASSDKAGVEISTLEDALPKADIISIHASGEKCILGTQELALAKPGAFLLNAARGGLVDEKALMSALDEKRIAGAWFDVFSQEPYNGPLAKYPQVILTPHLGSYTIECRKRMEMEAAENLINALNEDE